MAPPIHTRHHSQLRACASLLTDGAADPRVAVEHLTHLSQVLQAEAAKQRWDSGGSTYGGAIHLANKAASCMHRGSQLRHASRAVEEYATALRHGGARGWVTVFGEGGVDAMQPTLVPTLLALADAETALARARARPSSRPGARDHAHAPLAVQQQQLQHGAIASGGGSGGGGGGDGGGGGGDSSPYGTVAKTSSMHARRRLASASESLMREASLVADRSGLLNPPPPEHASVAARVLAGGGKDYAMQWRKAGHGKGAVHAELWGSTLHPQHGGTWLGAGWRWNERDADSDDSDAEEEERRAERARKARQAVRTANRLYDLWEPDNGVCIRCVERATIARPPDPPGALEAWSGDDRHHHHNRPTLLAR